ncbi:putative oxidoreductase YvaA [Posidoniimonas polymericola]|uniref:Putative oxidoreductase YvaA n=1 Tax=Posidoniimonas polymericola TaxID=2528002 RepID=A0A5C5YQZ5_9BACT|nr:Gfo/Idh/MocA family oxidoreductase [Posidoniimonas polymericola]TWT77336.1 putative oxidoreductase YvaA [Posidoniimonas polymericola]
MARHTRRFFLGSTAAAAAGLAIRPTRTLAAGASRDVTMGFIGMGGRGGEVFRQFIGDKNIRVGAFCDPDTDHLAKYAKDYPDAKIETDLRRVIDNPDIDAVMITTPNHWHCLAAIWAVQAGKHVYVEKPLSHNVWEGRQLVNAIDKHKVVAQIGTQQRSDPLQAEAKQFLHADQKLGKPQYVQACRFGVREPIGKRDTPLTPPESLDYSLWLGPAADQPLYRDRLHYDWHWNFNTGNGEMGNWGPHILDDIRNVAFQDEVTIPTRVFACGGRVLWEDAGESPNLHMAYYDTPVMPVFLGLSNLPARPGAKGALRFRGVESGYVVQCEDGYYTGWRAGGRAYDANGKLLREFKGDGGSRHVDNFLTAIREDDATLLNAPVVQGHHSTNWCHLANIAVQSGGRVDGEKIPGVADGSPGWDQLLGVMQEHVASHGLDATHAGSRMSEVLSVDPENERFTGSGSDKANQYLRREYRDGFAVPEIA